MHKPLQYKITACIAYFAISIALLMASGCTHDHAIQLEKVYQTSAYLNCEKVFARSRDSIVQLNHILIQTGTIDTVENAAIKAAVIHIAGKEIFLDNINTTKTGRTIKETYTGNGYKMQLVYTVKEISAGKAYEGKCDLWQGNLHTELEIAGMDSQL